MKRMILLMLLVATGGLSTVAQDPQPQTPPKPPAKHIVTAAQANGVYRYYKSEFRILALGHNKLKVQFDGVYTTLAKSINMGYATGEAVIDGNVATFKPPDTERCEITLVFLPGKLKVVQEGSDPTADSDTTSTPPGPIRRFAVASRSSNHPCRGV